MNARPGAAFPSRTVAAILAVAGLAVLLRSASAEPEAWTVSVTSLSGPPVEGSFESIGTGGLKLAGSAVPLPLGQIREASFPRAKAPAETATPKAVRLRLTLRGGEAVRGAFSSGAADWIEIAPTDLPVLKIPFDSIRRVEAEKAFKSLCDEPARGRPPRPGTDVAYSRSGDALSGTWVSAGALGVALESGGKKTIVTWEDLVVLQVDEPALPQPSGLTIEVATTGGSRLAAASVTGDALGLAVKTQSGLEVKVPAASVAALRFWGGSFVYASDLAWGSTFTAEYADSASFLAKWLATRADLTPNGCPLRVAGVESRHGFASHSKSVVNVPLGKAFVRFDCRFGIDDESLVLGPDGGKGDVTARILADGREVWTSGAAHVKGGEPARVVGPIDVTGVEALSLEVDFGTDKLVKDRADWCDPVLVRAH